MWHGGFDITYKPCSFQITVNIIDNLGILHEESLSVYSTLDCYYGDFCLMLKDARVDCARAGAVCLLHFSVEEWYRMD